MKIEFKKKGIPQNPVELGEHVEDIRSALVAGGKANEEALERVAADLKQAHEAVERSERAEKRVAELEENVKALHESSRTVSNGNLEQQLRSLPKVHRVEKDQDFAGKVSPPMFNLLALSRQELKTYLSGEALAWALRFRRLNNMTLTAHQLMSIAAETSPERREEYARKGGIKSSPLFAALQDCWKQGQRAIDTATAGGVSEWIPTVHSADKFDDVRDKLQAAGTIRFVPMPQSPWKIPTLLGFMTAYVIPEPTADAVGSNTQITASDPLSGNRQLDAQKIATLSWFSREVDQDSIVAILPMYDDEEVYAQAFAIETGFVNGQKTSTIDTGSDPATTDPRDNFDGLRWSAAQVAANVDLGAGLTAEKLANMIEAAGKYADPVNGRFLTGYKGMARALILKDNSGNLVYLTRERAGEAATLFTGAVGVLMGYPLVVSGTYPQNLNAVGVIDGAGTKSGVLFYNSQPWLGGNRQGLERTSDASERFSYDQVGVRSIQRVAIKSLLVPSAARPFVVAGVNL